MAELAINGGPKVIEGSIGAGEWPVRGAPERELLGCVLESGHWWRGWAEKESMVSQFEDGFAAFQDARFGVAVTNGTTAIECCLRAVGVEAGDEVIVPAATFIATASAVVLVGAVPVFADIDPDTYTISPAAVEAAITPRTRAIVVVDYGGMPCDYDAIGAIARRHALPVVADCAHAHGSQWRGTGVGALTECGTFSFQMGKTLTTGEGGMVLTNDEALASLLHSLGNLGRMPGRPFYEHHVFASNLRMTEWQGAIGLAQLARFGEQVATRERNSLRLARLLTEMDAGVRPLLRKPEVTRWCFYMWTFRFDAARWGGVTRNRFMEALGAEGVPGLWTGHLEPLYRNPAFVNAAFGRKGFPVAAPYHEGPRVDYGAARCPETERIAATEGVAINHRAFLGPEGDMDRIAEAIGKVWAGRDRLAGRASA